MSFKNFNRSLIVMSIGITLVVLFAGQNLYQRYALARPIYQAFNEIQGVENVIVQKPSLSNTLTILHITLGDVANIQTSYGQVVAAADKVYGAGRYTLMMEDHRTPALENAYYDIHFSIQQGIATGQFSDMADQIQKITSGRGVDAKVYVDNQAVYVQLKQGDGSLYKVIPRLAREEK